MAAPNEIKVSHLLRLIGLPDAPAIVDVSIDADFEADPHLIPGAFRHAHTDVQGLVSRLGGRRCVVVCQKGAKLSQGMAALLRHRGVQAEFLAGGNFGWRDCAEAPRVKVSALPPQQNDRTLWVTRHRPKIDRIACPWLLRRFIDPGAEILFVAPGEVMGVAERYGATPFDVPDTFWSHQEDRCTFDTMLEAFGLRTPALDRVAKVVRAADTNRHDLAPEAAGLLALSVGLSRQFKDDLMQLDAGMILYDALYRWARDGQGEVHDHSGLVT